MRAIEILSSLMDAVIAERGLHTADLPNEDQSGSLAKPGAESTEVAQGQGSEAPISRSKARHGPMPDVESARKVAEIRVQVAGAGPWKMKLGEICKELDAAGVPPPKTWSGKQLSGWADAAEKEPDLPRKAIAYRLRIAGRRNSG